MNRVYKLFALAIVSLGLSSCLQEEGFYTNVLRSDVFVQAYEDRRYDFLWIMDNSGSMQPRRDFVKDNLQTFINTLNSRKAIDYQMSIATTDYFNEAGNLVSSPSGQRVVKSAATSNPVGEFASMINAITDSPYSFWEQGLESAYQAVLKYGSEFMRSGVPLIVVFLTDEQDYSCKTNCFGVQPENNTNWVPWSTSRYMDYFKNVKKSENTDLVVFPIVGMSTGTCGLYDATNNPGGVASYGTHYMEVSAALGNYGVSGSICPEDLEVSYNNIAQTIADRGAFFKLSSTASGAGINVYVNGELVPYSPENYRYDEKLNAIIFTGFAPKNGAIIEVTYSQKVD